MNIGFIDKIKILFRVYATIPRQPVKYLFSNLVKPIDAVRFTELAHLLRFVEKNEIADKKILDVSSPHAVDYLLARKNQVVKINVDQKEKSYIKENEKLRFQTGDALKLDFENDTFDLVVSISVIEHIYDGYAKAVEEMVRVAKPGGYIYLTFPVAKEHREEWLDADIYSDRQKVGEKTFFQYRFGETDVAAIMSLPETETIAKDIYWEGYDGMYDAMIEKLRNRKMNEALRLLRIPFIHFYYGLSLFGKRSGDFTGASACGNLHLILKKK